MYGTVGHRVPYLDWALYYIAVSHMLGMAVKKYLCIIIIAFVVEQVNQ